jgi:hypothetical protein
MESIEDIRASFAQYRTNLMFTHVQEIDDAPTLKSYPLGISQPPANWLEEVIEWWNDWAINGYKLKKKQLYLWGPASMGKTSLIMKLLCTCLSRSNQHLTAMNINQANLEDTSYEEFVFRPQPNDFKHAYETFSKNIHKIAMLDEFDVTDYDVKDLKKMLAGETLTANPKGKKSQKISIQMPIIMISNLAPPTEYDNIKYKGITERIKVIKSDHFLSL